MRELRYRVCETDSCISGRAWIKKGYCHIWGYDYYGNLRYSHYTKTLLEGISESREITKNNQTKFSNKL